MSNERHANAKLEGYHGPFFTPSLDSLQDLICTSLLSKTELRDAAKRTPGFNEMPGDWVTTSDGYRWFSQLRFVSSAGHMIILVPWAMQARVNGRSSPDRSIATYALHHDEFDIDRVVDVFYHSLRDYIDEQAAALWQERCDQVRSSPTLGRYMQP